MGTLLMILIIIPVINVLLKTTLIGKCILLSFKIAKEIIKSLYYCIFHFYKLVSKINKELKHRIGNNKTSKNNQSNTSNLIRLKDYVK